MTITADAGADGPLPVLCLPSAPCPAGWYLYVDEACGPPRPDASVCSANGDGRCYLPCSVDDDCRYVAVGTCRSYLTIFAGSDVGTTKRVCDRTETLPPCVDAQ